MFTPSSSNFSLGLSRIKIIGFTRAAESIFHSPTSVRSQLFAIGEADVLQGQRVAVEIEIRTVTSAPDSRSRCQYLRGGVRFWGGSGIGLRISSRGTPPLGRISADSSQGVASGRLEFETSFMMDTVISRAFCVAAPRRDRKCKHGQVIRRRGPSNCCHSVGAESIGKSGGAGSTWEATNWC